MNILVVERFDMDLRIDQYIQATEKLQEGNFNIHLPLTPEDELSRLGMSIVRLAQVLEVRYRQLSKLDQITAQINSGLLLDEILEGVFRDFCELIPYDRIGFALIDDDGKQVRARWAKSTLPVIYLERDYAAPLEGSSLEQILQTGKPRILHDLVAYLNAKPESESTRLIVQEGIRSSLTCPLVANGVPVGFIFFSSAKTGAYEKIHSEIFERVAQQLSVIVEKGRLVSDLTDQNRKIEAQNQELIHLSEMKDSFLGMAAHDLRNPISSIQMIAEMLNNQEMKFEPEETREFLDVVLQQTKYMLNLLNDLLDISQIESGKINLELEDVDIKAFLGETIQRFNHIARQKKSKVQMGQCDQGLVRGDALRLRQVMDNLISNAVKYSPAGSLIKVNAFHNGALWRIEVIDPGPGISETDQKKLFKDFAKLSARPTAGEKSTGLGLAITRRVVEAHAGKIGVDSQLGQGSTFWIELPAALSTSSGQITKNEFDHPIQHVRRVGS